MEESHWGELEFWKNVLSCDAQKDDKSAPVVIIKTWGASDLLVLMEDTSLFNILLDETRTLNSEHSVNSLLLETAISDPTYELQYGSTMSLNSPNRPSSTKNIHF